MTSATDELRRMLDERGVEWTEGIARPELTQVRVDGKVVKFHSWQPNTLKVSLFNITPEQAIAATLGVETCHIVKASRKYVMSDGTELFEDGCSVCNSYIGEGDNYCPNCGRKVVDA